MVTLLKGGSSPTLRERIDESFGPSVRKWFYYLMIPLITVLHVRRSLENGQSILIWIVSGSVIMTALLFWYEVLPRLRRRDL
jgi:predicted permease